MKRTRAPMSQEVNAAVEDLLHGVNVDSHTEWLQREYLRLMRREARMRQECESKLKALAKHDASTDDKQSANNDGDLGEDRTVKQHGSADNGVGSD